MDIEILKQFTKFPILEFHSNHCHHHCIITSFTYSIFSDILVQVWHLCVCGCGAMYKHMGSLSGIALLRKICLSPFISSLNNIRHSDIIWLHNFSSQYSRILAGFYCERIMHAKSTGGNSRVQVCLNTHQILAECRDKLVMADWHGVSHGYGIWQTRCTSWPIKFKVLTVNAHSL